MCLPLHLPAIETNVTGVHGGGKCTNPIGSPATVTKTRSKEEEATRVMSFSKFYYKIAKCQPHCLTPGVGHHDVHG